MGVPISWPDGEIFGTVCVLHNPDCVSALSYAAYGSLTAEQRSPDQEQYAAYLRQQRQQDKPEHCEVIIEAGRQPSKHDSSSIVSSA
jgi:hypothetical protein